MPTPSSTAQMLSNSRTADKFVLRLPEGLRDRINLEAGKNHRSMNGEIIARIDRSLDLEDKYEEMRQLNRYLLKRIEVLENAAQDPLKLVAKS